MKKLFLLSLLIMVFSCVNPILPQSEKGYGILKLENNYKQSAYGFHTLGLNINSQQITLTNGGSKEIGLKEGSHHITGYLSIPLMSDPLSINESVFIISGLKTVRSWP